MGEKFNPNEHLRTLTRRKKIKDATGERWVSENHVYLDVKWRLIWFRNAYPEGFIETVEAGVNDKFARIEATVYDKDPAHGGKKLGMGRRLVYALDFKDYIEKAETQAIGRALAVAGFGTQFCEEFDEEDSFADSPVEPRKQHSAQSTPSGPPAQRASEKEHTNAMATEKASVLTDANLAYDAALLKGLTQNDVDLLVNAKFQKGI